MADMRDFPAEPVMGSTFAPVNEDFRSERIDLSGEGIENSDIRPLDETSDLGSFHAVEPEESRNTGKLVGALAVALIIGGAGVFAFTANMHGQKPVTDAALPHPTPPAAVAAATPPPAPLDQTTSSDTAPAQDNAAPAQSSAPITAPVTRTPVRSARTHEGVITQKSAAAQPSPSAGASAVPEAVSPTPPASSLAANAPDQTAPQTAPANPSTAQDMPAPAPQDNAQAQNQTPVQTAPDQAQPVQPQPAPQPAPQTPDNSQPAQPQ